MLNNQVYYHGLIRQAIVGFGKLFSNIYIDRKEGDSVTGTTKQRIKVPLAYAPKEKWLVRLEQDPELDNHTYISLPRMSFEIIGYLYDAQRKTPRMGQIKYGQGTLDNKTMYSPAPYTIDLSMYVLSKNQEDGLQIIEQILPVFTPEYTLSINAVPDMGIRQDVPVILNSVQVVDEYDGDFQQRRFVTHTLNFQMKINLYGPESSQGVIDHVETNIGQNEDFSNPNRTYVAEGDPVTATLDSESWEFNF
jgi:hypothetical protein